MNLYTPEACHIPLLNSAPRQLAFEKAVASNQPVEHWQNTVREKLRELLGVTPARVPLDLQIESRTNLDEYEEIRFHFTTEANALVPCHLLLPSGVKAPVPVVICLQGHSTGMHISLGRPKYPGDEDLIHGGDRDFALQVVREGWAALVLEQRCFGERADQRPAPVHDHSRTCDHATMAALLLGRTMIGERTWDVSRAIDALEHFPELDLGRIGCMGNSGGGTISFYAACLDQRISIVMPSCSFCAYENSIGDKDHCPDNYIPGVLRHFELGDLAGAVAPRPMVVVAGRQDVIFPIEGVQTAYAVAERIYEAVGAAGQCRLVVGEGGHRFYAEPSWPVFRELAKW